MLTSDYTYDPFLHNLIVYNWPRLVTNTQNLTEKITL